MKTMKLLALAGAAQLALLGAVDAKGCSPKSYGDGWCDEHNNFEECEYDHGDCCMEVRTYFLASVANCKV